MKYSNPWYQRTNTYSRPFFETDAKPVEYKGYKIYPRIDYGIGYSGNCFDILLNDVLISQYAGLNGAKRFIDSRI